MAEERAQDGTCYLCDNNVTQPKWACSECSRLFCPADCGGKYLLASLGETAKRFICSSCLPGIRKQIEVAKSRGSTHTPSSTSPTSTPQLSSTEDDEEEEESESGSLDSDEEESSDEDTTGDINNKATTGNNDDDEGAPRSVASLLLSLPASTTATAVVGAKADHHNNEQRLSKTSRISRSEASAATRLVKPKSSRVSRGRSRSGSGSSELRLGSSTPPARRPSLTRHHTQNDLRVLDSSPRRGHTRSQTLSSSPGRTKNPFGNRSLKGHKKSNSKGGSRIKTERSSSRLAVGSSSRRKRSSAAPEFDLMNSTLEEIMAWQAGKPLMAQLKIPYVIQWLLENILKYRGNLTEGIFRLSITSSQIQEFKTRLSHANFNFDTNDPHCYAVMLKHFLRELPTPLIPDYDVCMNARDADLKSNSGLATYWKLWDETIPPVSKEVILTLTDFLLVMTMPQNVLKTKMSLENYVIVFAPAFLRNPSTDVQSMLLGQGREANFVEQLLIFCRDHVRLKANSSESVDVVETLIEYVDENGDPCDPPEEGEDVDIVEVIEYVDGSSDSSSEDINVLM